MRGTAPFLRHHDPWRRPPLSRSHRILFLVTAVFYTAIVVGVLTTSRLVQFDWHVAISKPYKQWPHARAPLDIFVIAGQRGPSALAALGWLAWRACRTRCLRPLLVLVVALLLLNLSVGAVKLGTGRLGPHYAHTVGSAEIFRGGLIFPSGHTANGVVTWGTLAYLAARHRRAKFAAAGIVAFTIGLTTIYLGTHWVSDVLGGWAAGVLVLLALPLCEPLIAITDQRIRACWAGRHTPPVPFPAVPVSAQPGIGARRPLVGLPGRQPPTHDTYPEWPSRGPTASHSGSAARAPPVCPGPGSLAAFHPGVCAGGSAECTRRSTARAGRRGCTHRPRHWRPFLGSGIPMSCAGFPLRPLCSILFNQVSLCTSLHCMGR